MVAINQFTPRITEYVYIPKAMLVGSWMDDLALLWMKLSILGIF